MAEAVRRKGGWVPRYRDPNTKQRAVVPGTPTYATQAEAEVAAKVFEDGLRAMVGDDWFDPATTTFLTYCHRVIADMRKARKPQPGTITGYEREINRCIAPFDIANTLTVQIKVSDLVDKWWNEGVLVTFNGKIATQDSAKSVISRVLHIAHARGHLLGLRELPLALMEPQAHKKVDVRKRIKRLTEEEYELLLAPDSPEAHLMWVETAGESGCRPDEVFALEPTQFLWATNELHVYRSVVWLSADDAERDNDGDTVKINDFTKTKDERTVPMAPEYMVRMRAFIEKHGIRDGELIFSRARMGVGPASTRLPWVDLSKAEGYATSAKGVRHRHGTTQAYDICKCHCDWCRAAKRQALRTPEEQYQTQRKDGRTLSRPPQNDACPQRAWVLRFRRIFVRAGIDWKGVEPYDMRHAHAVWLAFDPEMTALELMKRLGHDNLKTTQGYIDEAREARNSVAARNRSRRYQAKLEVVVPAAETLGKAELAAEIQRLTALLVT